MRGLRVRINTATPISVLQSAAGVELLGGLCFCTAWLRCSVAGSGRGGGGEAPLQPPLPKHAVGWFKNAGACCLTARGPQEEGMAWRRATAKG